jgi:predicted RNase H-like HicB family nuclease
MKCKNTLQKGKMRYIVFRDKKDEKDMWYGVGLEFNIVESGDTPREAMLLLFEAVTGYVESARKIKARPHILNQRPDREYEEMWEHLEQNKEIPAGEVFTFGNFNIRKGVSISV